MQPTAMVAPVPPDPALETLSSAQQHLRIPKVRSRGKFTKWLAICWLALIVFTAIGASWLPYVNSSCDGVSATEKKTCISHIDANIRMNERPPSWAVWADAPKNLPGAPDRAGWFGTDRNGYDIFARSMFGARTSLLIGGLSILFGLLIGGALGLTAGYFRGWVDRLIDGVMNIMLAFPALLLAIFIVGFFTDSGTDAAKNRPIWPIVMALVVLSIPPLTRLVRANTIAYAQREFVLAARSLGAKGSRVMFKEILPNVVPALVSFALTGMAILIVAEGALAFLGLSVEAPSPTWGKMIFAGKDRLQDGAWWISMMPAATMFLTILSINLLGDIYSQRFNRREAIG